MPIRIDNDSGESPERIEWLCDDVWELPELFEAFESWVLSNANKLQPGKYSADIGFSPRENALGGGGYLSPKALKLMANIGMALYLSEYPAFVEE